MLARSTAANRYNNITSHLTSFRTCNSEVSNDNGIVRQQVRRHITCMVRLNGLSHLMERVGKLSRLAALGESSSLENWKVEELGIFAAASWVRSTSRLPCPTNREL